MTEEEYDKEYDARTEMHEIHLDLHVFAGVEVTLRGLLDLAQSGNNATNYAIEILRGMYEQVCDVRTSAEVQAGYTPGTYRVDNNTNDFVRIMECERILTFTRNFHQFNSREATRRRIARYARNNRLNPASSLKNRA